METLRLEIVTPEGQIFSDDVKDVTLPGSEGEFGVYPGHASLVSLLQAGVIDIELKNGNHEVVAINWGHAKVDENSVTVLADGAVSIAGDTESQIANSLENARKLLESMSDSDFAIAAATAKIESIAKSRF
ncbi:MAG TPA: F0F1 ATP synthase subunit epsilon [Sulfurospirillum sp. UBA11407]|jgi:F-type H+-transporting ATPase subunit epsilon|nr:MAG TPA: F0F1 ATP synthase subunit epsilon [Sulfurospirillum sp. UBA11407]DAB32998.1 MAG TPA: F0F1 ATP synthase subunit epsilon [Sulfurospirillum sp. UBA11407]